MRGRRAALCAALWLTLLTVRPAAAAPAPTAPLRTLVYAMTVTSKTTNEEHTSGFRRATPLSAETQVSGNATVKRVADVDDDGTLTIGVVAATGDGGLVVDAAYDGKATVQPSIRVGITAEGRLLYDPKRPLSVEAERLLPYLARGFVANRDVSPGGAWTIALPAPAHGSIAYTVSANAGSVATITIVATIQMPGNLGYSETDRGTLVYDTERLCPKRYELEVNEFHSPSPEEFVSTRALITATLRSDTFA